MVGRRILNHPIHVRRSKCGAAFAEASAFAPADGAMADGTAAKVRNGKAERNGESTVAPIDGAMADRLANRERANWVEKIMCEKAQ